MSSDMLKEIFEIKEENQQLKKENQQLKEKLKSVSSSLSFANKRIEKLEKQVKENKNKTEKLIEKAVEEAVEETRKKLSKQYEEKISNLEAKIKRYETLLNTDSTNSGTPTSKQRIGKQMIQNNREKSGLKKGGQPGHKINKLEYFTEEEITDRKEFKLDKCPNCGSEDIIETGTVKSDIVDIKIKVTKTRNVIHNYKCKNCKKTVSANNDLPRGVTYGSNVNAMAITMMNGTNTALNKVASFISGITNGEVNLSEGYLVKLQAKCAKKLDTFIKDLKKKILTLHRLFWDDTVCKFGIEVPAEGFDDDDIKYLENKGEIKIRNGVIRIYCDDLWALLIGHKYKNNEGIIDDGILPLLPEECVVMHDHLLINYNEKHKHDNAECNVHTTRYLTRNISMFPKHTWASEMKNLLINTNKKKHELIEQGINSFTDKELETISNNYDEIIKKGYNENSSVDLVYILDITDELNLIKRLDKFKRNHLLFAYDFTVAFSNNTAERGLRQVKRKLAVSFMFKNANRMKDYATILSYLESCFRHGISRFEATKKLVQGSPYTVEELEKMHTTESEKN